MKYIVAILISFVHLLALAGPPVGWESYQEVGYKINMETEPPSLDTVISQRYRPNKSLNTKPIEGVLASGMDSLRMKDYIRKLSSFTFDGRKQGTDGEKIAAQYIAKHMSKEGIIPLAGNANKLLPYSFTGESFKQYQLSVWYKPYEFLEDFYAFQKSNRLDAWFDDEEVTFLGYGIDDPKYSDYKGNKVHGKIILIYPGEPLNADSISYLTGTEDLSDWSMNWRRKLETAQKYGVKSVIFIERSHKYYMRRYKKFLEEIYYHETDEDISEKFAPSIYISQAVAARMIGNGSKVKEVVKAKEQITNSGRPKSVRIPTKLEMSLVEKHHTLSGNNLAYYIEGSDPAYKDEVVLVTAHHDAGGFNMEGLHDGADKNASGVAALMEMATQLKNLQTLDFQPRRSILLLSYSTGELEHFGLKYFLNEAKIDTSKIKVHINIESIGGIDSTHTQYPYYIYPVTENDILKNLCVQVNNTFTHQWLDQSSTGGYDLEETACRYTNELGIPSILLTAGKKSYSGTPDDEIEMIHTPSMLLRAQFAFLLAYKVGNLD